MQRNLRVVARTHEIFFEAALEVRVRQLITRTSVVITVSVSRCMPADPKYLRRVLAMGAELYDLCFLFERRLVLSNLRGACFGPVLTG